MRQHFLDPKLKDPEVHMKRFRQLTFDDILKDLNMTKTEYINALRTTVKGKYSVFHSRKPACLLINNYNPPLLLLNGANMDLTWISGMNSLYNISGMYICFADAFATISYILGYLTKVKVSKAK